MKLYEHDESPRTNCSKVLAKDKVQTLKSRSWGKKNLGTKRKVLSQETCIQCAKCESPIIIHSNVIIKAKFLKTCKHKDSIKDHECNYYMEYMPMILWFGGHKITWLNCDKPFLAFCIKLNDIHYYSTCIDSIQNVKNSYYCVSWYLKTSHIAH